LVDNTPKSKAPRLSSFALQHIQVQGPFFFTLCFQRAHENVAHVLTSLALRVWLPSLRPTTPNSQVLFPAPNTHGLRSSELFSFLEIKKPFRVFFTLLRFLMKPHGFISALQRLTPSKKAVLIVRSGGLIRSGGACSLELSDLSGRPVIRPMKKAFFLFHLPRVLRKANSFKIAPHEPQGTGTEPLGISPPKRGANLFGLFADGSKQPL
jgi:hypothetical protein